MIFSGNKGKANEKTKAEKFSSRVLYVLAALTAVIFGCFYMIGYDIPSDDEYRPFTDAVIIFVILLIITALAVTAFAVAGEIRRHDRDTANANNIPSRRIAAVTAAVTAACMSVTFIAGSAHPMFVNGTQYTTAFWLKAADMFIITGIILIAAAIIMVITERIRYNNIK